MPRGRRSSDEPDYAAIGAKVRLQELQAEIAKILRRFPQLNEEVPLPRGAVKKARKKRTFSPEQREAARKRMAAYWKERKKQEKADAK